MTSLRSNGDSQQEEKNEIRRLANIEQIVLENRTMLQQDVIPILTKLSNKHNQLKIQQSESDDNQSAHSSKISKIIESSDDELDTQDEP